ncbi:MAG: aminotransferase class I/II-fold pyridoxal phosphate-dependent enzyme [Lachnospiraceae bacterium]
MIKDSSLYEKLRAYAQEDYYPFHMPGHKRNPAFQSELLPFGYDITEIDGFDNLHHATGILEKAQRRAADLYGAAQTLFSVNGSSAALLAAISAATTAGGQMLIARNCHKAVYHAAMLLNLRLAYVYPSNTCAHGSINGGISAQELEAILQKNKAIQAVLITSPTYDGVVSDVRRIAEVVHSYNLPLILDEAHGAHFPFHSYFPEAGNTLGADVVINSLHKTLPALTQTALLHCNSERIAFSKIKKYMEIYQSTSPSYILMASIDYCIQLLETDGRELLERYVQRLENLRAGLQELTSIRLLGYDEVMQDPTVKEYDRSKLLFYPDGTTGKLYRDLLEQYHIQMEMVTPEYVLGITSLADTQQGYDRLTEALTLLDRQQHPSGKRDVEKYHRNLSSPKVNCTIGAAMESETCRQKLKESSGCTAAEFLYLYPPGVPLLVPGEVIQNDLLEAIEYYKCNGFSLQGLQDKTNEFIEVLAVGSSKANASRNQ